MFKVLVNYNFTPDKSWIGEDYLIYDRSDDGIDHLTEFDPNKVKKTDNVGQVDYDKLRYLVDNYDKLPEVFLWGKTNLFKYITRGEYEKVKDNNEFTPLLTQNHETYSDIMRVTLSTLYFLGTTSTMSTPITLAFGKYSFQANKVAPFCVPTSIIFSGAFLSNFENKWS